MILIGLSGSGKTTVGRIAAGRLGATFTDLDGEVERIESASVREIFARQGEERFRHLERNAMRAALTGPPGVIASGGGWAAQPGNLEGARHGSIVLYLNTAPGVAARRIADAPDRPLLGTDPEADLAAQLSARRPFYERADAVLDTDDLSAAEVADVVVALARDRGGW